MRPQKTYEEGARRHGRCPRPREAAPPGSESARSAASLASRASLRVKNGGLCDDLESESRRRNRRRPTGSARPPIRSSQGGARRRRRHRESRTRSNPVHQACKCLVREARGWRGVISARGCRKEREAPASRYASWWRPVCGRLCCRPFIGVLGAKTLPDFSAETALNCLLQPPRRALTGFTAVAAMTDPAGPLLPQ